MRKILCAFLLMSAVLFGSYAADSNGKEIGRISLSDSKEITVYSDGKRSVFITLPIVEETKGNRFVVTEKEIAAINERFAIFDKVVAEVKSGNNVRFYDTILFPIPLNSPSETFLFIDVSCGGSLEKTTCILRYSVAKRGAGVSYRNSIHLTEAQVREFQNILQEAIKSDLETRQKIVRLKNIISNPGS